MVSSKLFETLRVLTPPQWRRFGDLLASPYFNRRTELLVLYRYLTPFHPELEHPNLDKKRVLARWPEAPKPDEKKLANLMSQLLDLAGQFLAIDYLQNDAATQGELLLRAFQQLENSDTDKPLAAALDNLRKHQDRSPLRDADALQGRFKLAWWEYLTRTERQRLAFNPLLQEASNRLDAFYIAQKLRFLTEMASQHRILHTNYAQLFELAPGLLPAAHPLRQEPAVAVYLAALQVIRNDEPADLDIFLDVFRRHRTLFVAGEQKTLYAYALNFCTRRINQFNDHTFFHTYLDLNAEMLRENLLLDNGVIQPWNFLNIVNAGIKTGRWEWTRAFIDDMASRLPGNAGEPYAHFALAQWHYAQKQYGQAQKWLAVTDFPNVIFSLAARSLLIKIYVENEDSELLHAALEAARVYLLRVDNMDPGLRRQMQNFLDFTRRIARVYPPDADKYRAIEAALPLPGEVMHRDWLLERLRR